VDAFAGDRADRGESRRSGGHVGISFVMNYLVRREYENANLFVLLFWPYVRMSLVMTALAAGLVVAALIPALDTSSAFGVAVVLVKTAADLVMHQVEHAMLARKTTAP
jgi:hypothetical protein